MYSALGLGEVGVGFAEARRADRGGPGYPRRMRERNQLGDHAAHRHSNEMGALDAVSVEDRDGVVGEIVEGVGGLTRLAMPSGP